MASKKRPKHSKSAGKAAGKSTGKKSPAAHKKTNSTGFPWLFALAPTLLALMLYAGTAGHGFVLDDESAITKNSIVQQGTDAIGTIFSTSYRAGYWNSPGTLYRPISLAAFAWFWELSPNDPALGHVLNILLYGISTLLLFLLLWRWFGRGDPWLPLLICLVFVAHPIHTEVVANIKSADELLAFTFLLGALYLLWSFVARKNVLPLVFSVLLFGLAMFSKESSITFFAVIPLALWFFSKEKVLSVIALSTLYLVPIAVFLFVRYKVLDSVTTENMTVASIDNMLKAIQDPGVRIATAIKICGLYLWKMVLPHPLSHDYSLHEITRSSLGDWKAWVSLLAYVGMGVFALLTLLKRNLLSFAILLFLATFSLYSNLIIHIGTHFGERLLFMPSLGFAIAVGYGLWWLATKNSWRDTAARFSPGKAIVPLALAGLLLVLYSYKTVARAAEWESELILYAADRENAPNSSRTHYRYGRSLMTQELPNTKGAAREQLLKESVEALRQSLRIYPKYSDARGELGLAFARLGLPDSAARHYTLALQTDSHDYNTLNNFGSLLFEQGKLQRAKTMYERALKYNPNYVEAMGNLASTYGTLGDFPAAIKQFKKAAAHKPSEASYHYYIGVTYQNMGVADSAQLWLNSACKMNPQYCTNAQR